MSVREHFLQKKFSEMGRKDVYTVLEPVFLLTRQDYSKLAKTPKEKNIFDRKSHQTEKNNLTKPDLVKEKSAYK